VYAINPVDFDFAFDFPLTGKRIVAPGAMAGALLGLAKAANDVGHLPDSHGLASAISGLKADDASAALIKTLGDANASVVLFGESAAQHPKSSWLRAAARFVAKATGSAYNEIPAGANALGLARVGALPRDGGLDAREMLRAPRKAYVLYGCEPPEDFGDGALALEALSQAESVVAFSAYASDALKRVASVILPIGLVPEIDATLVNVDGVSQTVAPGAKPPGEARQGWRVLRALGAALSVPGFDFTPIDEVRAQIASDASEHSGSTTSTTSASASWQSTGAMNASGAQSLERIATTAIYRADAVLRHTPALQAHPLTRGALAMMNPEDGLALGLGQGASARFAGVALPVELSKRVPRGAVWIEAGYAETAALPAHGASVDIARIAP
jgi:NADH-quinone oxidoreductase subunit G